MLKKKCIGAMLLAAAAVSTSAMAGDRGVNTVVGALAGAAIGGSVGGRDGALVGGAIGAAVGNSVRTNDDYYSRNRGYAYSITSRHRPTSSPVRSMCNRVRCTWNRPAITTTRVRTSSSSSAAAATTTTVAGIAAGTATVAAMIATAATGTVATTAAGAADRPQLPLKTAPRARFFIGRSRAAPPARRPKHAHRLSAQATSRRRRPGR
jgi:hypothetical protein